MPQLHLEDGEIIDLNIPARGKFAFDCGNAVVRAAGEADSRRVRVIVTTQAPDRAGDIIVTQGIQTASYMANPVVLLQHRADSPIARCVELVTFEGRMEAVAEFPPEGVSEQSDRVLRMIRAGILNAVSVGLNPLENGVEWLDPKNPFKGVRYTKTEMLEFSFVSIPMNAQALIIQRSLGETTADSPELSVLRALVSEFTPEPPASEPAEQPPAPEVLPENTPEPPCNREADAALLRGARLREVEVYRRRVFL